MRLPLKKIAKGAGLTVVGLLAIMSVRATSAKSKQPSVTPVAPAPIDSEAAAAHLASALRAKTIASEAEVEPELDALREMLAKTYPRVHSALNPETIGHGVLFTWKGKDANAAPVLLLAHLDVVPVDEGQPWTHPAFEGFVDPPGAAERFVWGRGALDDKVGIIGLLEAAESLLTEGFTPERTILLAFGSDEEVGGKRGAVKLAEALGARGIHPYFVLDEGGAITHGIVPNVKAPVAVVGISEKGYLTVDLSIGGLGGHSSSPPPDTAISILAAAVKRLVDTPFAARMDGPTHTFLEWTAPEMPFGPRLALTNQWLLGPLVERGLSKSPAANASIRTTTAPTLFHAGNTDNVLPATATATVNFRIVPGDTTDSVIAHVKSTIDDARIEVRPRAATATEPSVVSPADGPEFGLVARTIREVFPDTIIAPALTIGATDARRYTKLTSAVYRFLPIELGSTELERIHGTNERLGVEALAKAIRFYRRIMQAR